MKGEQIIGSLLIVTGIIILMVYEGRETDHAAPELQAIQEMGQG